MLRITPCRTKISDRFPVASFVVQVPPKRYFEVACATDPDLFHADHIGRRNSSNFASSRLGGLLRAPAGQATYIVPPEQLRRFAGATRLYYALGAYGGQRGEDPAFTIAPDAPANAPCIQIAPDFTGRALDRGRLAGKQPAEQRYGAGDRGAPGWGGDDLVRTARSAGGSRKAGTRLGSPQPATEEQTYDDGFDSALWADNPSHQDEAKEYLARRRGEQENREEEARARREKRAAAESDGTLRFLPVQGIENVSEAFKDRVYEIAEGLEADANHLMAVMSFETGGTFSPSVRNAAGSGATGLIQFMPSTAKRLGTTTEKLAALTAEEQLDYVWSYFEPNRGRLKTLEDTYMAVLWPAAIGKGSAHVLFREGEPAYQQNAGLDRDKNGEVTVADAASFVTGILATAEAKDRAVSEGKGRYGRPLAGARWAGEEPEGYEDAPDLASRGDARGYEDAPDIARRMGRRQPARFGRAGSALADEEPYDAPSLRSDPPTGGELPPTEWSARYPDFSAEPVPQDELPVELAAGMAEGDVEDSAIPFDAAERLQVIHHVATLESGADVYSAINADTEFNNPRLPRFYQKRHVGLSWGFIQFAQAFGGLGKALAACQRRDEAGFQRSFGQNASDLLAVTSAATEAERLKPVVPPGGTSPQHLWEPAWTAAFRTAGKHRPFQEAQREAADTEYYEPFTTLLWWLGFSSARAQAMFLDRSIHMGQGAAVKWVVETVGPIKTLAQRDAALAHLGASSLLEFQRTPPHAGASWLVPDGQWGAQTHAALIWSLRKSGGGPIAIPTRDQMLALMVAEADRREQAAGAGDMTWSLIATRLRKLHTDPELAQLPKAG
jgi:hypothetical protein